MELEFSEYFQQADFCDADLALVVWPEAENRSAKRARHGDIAEGSVQVLSKFPAHQLVLCRESAYIKSQAQRWSSTSASGTRPVLQLTLDSAEQETAAVAVLATMYRVPDAMSQLSDVQLVDAVLIADRIQATAALQQAVQLLQKAATRQGGLSSLTLTYLAGLQQWPECMLELLPSIINKSAWYERLRPDDKPEMEVIAQDQDSNSIQQLLVATLGDLDVVWGNKQLSNRLLQLPAAAVLLLLSSDELPLASEDTVVYTISRYIQNRHRMTERKALLEHLAPAVRCPQLSDFLLTGLLTTTSSNMLLVGKYSAELRVLQAIRCAVKPEHVIAAVRQHISSAPSSWALGPRQIKSQTSVSITLQLPVDEIKAGSLEAMASGGVEVWERPELSAPLHGVAWSLQLLCDTCQQCSKLYLSPVAKLPLRGVMLAPQLEIRGPSGVYDNREHAFQLEQASMVEASNCCFDSYYMTLVLEPIVELPNGWDDAVWSSKGFPAQGSVEWTMTVFSNVQR